MTYVMSDIHGHMGRFRSVLRQIRLEEDDVLYVLGHVIDRHPDGIRILSALMASPNVRMIPGNHEDMMLRAMDVPYDLGRRDQMRERARAFALWYANGGEVTHRTLTRMGEAERERIFRYLRGLPLSLEAEVGDTPYLMVHAAPVSMTPPGEDERMYALWHRLTEEEPVPEGKAVVFGHTPTDRYQDDDPLRIWYGGTRIGIDCGSGFPEMDPVCGRLACLRLDDMAEFYSEM